MLQGMFGKAATMCSFEKGCSCFTQGKGIECLLNKHLNPFNKTCLRVSQLNERKLSF